MNRKLFYIAVAAGLISSLPLRAQGYYDDDIYFNATKVKKENAEKAKKAAEERAAANYVKNVSQDFPGADTYQITGDTTRDVDEYNRRGPSASSNYSQGSAVTDSLLNGDFAYTRRIERYHNPNIVEGSDDADLQYLYYNDEQELQKAAASVTQVNVYIDSPWGWSWPYWTSRYWGPSWSVNWGWWPTWGWGPSWSWGWDPFWAGSWGWSIGWGPGWGFGWNYGWGWGPGWGYGGWWGHHHAWGGPSWGGGWHQPRRSSAGATSVHGSRVGSRSNMGNVGTRRGLGTRMSTSAVSRSQQGNGTINNNARPGQRAGANVGTNRTPSRSSGSTVNRQQPSRSGISNQNSGLGTRGGSSFGSGGGSRGGNIGGGSSGGGSRGRR